MKSVNVPCIATCAYTAVRQDEICLRLGQEITVTSISLDRRRCHAHTSNGEKCDPFDRSEGWVPCLCLSPIKGDNQSLIDWFNDSDVFNRVGGESKRRTFKYELMPPILCGRPLLTPMLDVLRQRTPFSKSPRPRSPGTPWSILSEVGDDEQSTTVGDGSPWTSEAFIQEAITNELRPSSRRSKSRTIDRRTFSPPPTLGRHALTTLDKRRGEQSTVEDVPLVLAVTTNSIPLPMAHLCITDMTPDSDCVQGQTITLSVIIREVLGVDDIVFYWSGPCFDGKDTSKEKRVTVQRDSPRASSLTIRQCRVEDGGVYTVNVLSSAYHSVSRRLILTVISPPSTPTQLVFHYPSTLYWRRPTSIGNAKEMWYMVALKLEHEDDNDVNNEFEVAVLSLAECKWALKDVPTGVYRMRVRAYNMAGMSAWSEELGPVFVECPNDDDEEVVLDAAAGKMPTRGISYESVHAHYRLGDVLGAGRAAIVKRAECIATGRLYAVKCGDDRDSMTAEFNILNKLRHENIIATFGLFDDHAKDMITAMVLKLIIGHPIIEYMCDYGHYSEASCAHVLRQLLGAVAYIHERHIVHNHIHPENVLVEHGDGVVARVVLIDFGRAQQRLVEEVDDAENAEPLHRDRTKTSHRLSLLTPPALSSPTQTLLNTHEKHTLSTIVSSVCLTNGDMAHVPFLSPQCKAYSATVHQHTAMCDVWSVGVLSMCLLAGTTDTEHNFDHISEEGREAVNGMLAHRVGNRSSASEVLNSLWLNQALDDTAWSTDKLSDFVRRRSYELSTLLNPTSPFRSSSIMITANV